MITREIKRMGSVMKSHFVSEVCMESTGIYWIPVWRLLENNFQLRLVNAQFLKQLPGRKSDVKDAEWIATVLLKEWARDNFVPDGNIQSLRQYGRRINEINKDLVRCQQHIDMILQRCNIRLSNYVSNMDSKSYRKVVDALIKAETSSYELVKLVHGRTIHRYSKSIIQDALEGDVKQSDRDLLLQYTQMFDLYQLQKQQCMDSMIQKCNELYPKAFFHIIGNLRHRQTFSSYHHIRNRRQHETVCHSSSPCVMGRTASTQR